MTLAVILFVSMWTSSASPVTARAARQSAQNPSPDSKPTPPVAQDSSTTSTPAAATSASPQASSPPKQAAPVKRRRKKATTANCVPAPASKPATTGSESKEAPADGTAPVPATTTAPTVCPPPKVIVRQGGTADPAIQLAGGAVGDQAAHQRDTANQMLGAAEANLKKIAGRQLDAKQQDMVKQIHQFMTQSKSAVAAGDPERGRTLAWKAQLLSEELANPQR